MSHMQLVPRGPSWRELWAVKIADALLVAGQQLHARFAVVPDEPTGDELFVRLETWRTRTMQFITFGDPLNFSERRMEEAGVALRQARKAYLRVLKAAGMLVVYERSGVYWVHPWTKRGALVMIRRRMISLPYPTGQDAPPLFVGRVADAQLPQRTQLPQVRTVFAESAPEGPTIKGE